MTRFLVVRDYGALRETHPDTDPTGYPTATDANLACLTLGLSGAYYIHPVSDDPQPARLGGTQ